MKSNHNGLVMSIAKGTARIKHRVTGVIYDIAASDLEFEVTGFEDRSMGPEFSYEARLDHPELGELLWQVWEYPTGAENHRETNIEPHTLIRDFDIDFHGPEEPDIEGEWDDVQSLAEQKRQARIDAMVEWFHERFEDPAQETPYNGREGGYQYIHGGPFDAREELEANFPNEAEDLIVIAVDEIESDGLTEWAPRRTEQEFEDFEFELEPLSQDEIEVGSEAYAAEVAAIESLIDALPFPARYPALEVRNDGLVHFATPPDAEVSNEDDPLRQELREALAALLAALVGTNAHTEILTAAQRYSDVLKVPEYSVSQLYARGVPLESAAWSTEEQIKRNELPPLPGTIAGSLRTVLQLHASLIMRNPEGRALTEDAIQFQRPYADVAVLQSAINNLADAVKGAPELISREVREQVEEAVAILGASPHPERTIQIAGTTIGQVAVSLLKWVRNLSIYELVSGALSMSAVGVSVLAAGGAGIDAAVAFLVVNASSFHLLAGALGADLGWTAPMAQIFERIANIRIGNDKRK